jgi:hypothetical protein
MGSGNYYWEKLQAGYFAIVETFVVPPASHCGI